MQRPPQRSLLMRLALACLLSGLLVACDAELKPPPPSAGSVTPAGANVAGESPDEPPRLDPDGDEDGDQYSNEVERLYGADPLDPMSTPPDVDGDLIVDALDDDMDNDGFSNEVERRYDSDPRDPSDAPADLDGDGTPDGDDSDRDRSDAN